MKEEKNVTIEQVKEWEANMLIEAVGSCIEINDLFLDRNCSNDFASLLKQAEDLDYAMLDLPVKEWWFNGSPTGHNSQHVWLNISEIEFQFVGDPEDVFEDVNDWYIKEGSDLAYLNVGYGLSINYDLAVLRDYILDVVLYGKLEDQEDYIKETMQSLKQECKQDDLLGWVDVRLQYHDGDLRLWTGDPPYDTDHRGNWGATSISAASDIDEVYSDLVRDLKEFFAQTL